MIKERLMRVEDLPEALPGLNVREGLTRIGGDPESYRRLLRKFSRNQADAAGAAKRLLAANDVTAAARVIHSLAGVAGNVGAAGLCAAARRLEAALLAGGNPDAGAALHAVEEQLAETMESARRLTSLTRPEPASSANADPRRAAPLLDRLESAVAASEASSVRLFAELKALLPPSLPPGVITALEAALDEYNFEAAGEAVRSLRAIMKKG
jgi:two-component system sensor histidine kinase/response regulator